jgi:hypothetical protein
LINETIYETIVVNFFVFVFNRISFLIFFLKEQQQEIQALVASVVQVLLFFVCLAELNLNLFFPIFFCCSLAELNLTF